MDRALDADPGNLEVLLSLGVSHTNELDASEALSYLHRWITAHPTHGPAAGAAPGPPDSSQRHAYVVSATACDMTVAATRTIINILPQSLLDPAIDYDPAAFPANDSTVVVLGRLGSLRLQHGRAQAMQMR